MKIVNLCNFGHRIFIFQREGNRKFYTIDDSFLPYYYEPDDNGKYISIFGDKKYKKVFVSDPKIVSKQRSKDSSESDILFRDRYYIDKINKIDDGEIKYAFIDIEVSSKDLPDPEEAKYVVSCASVYNSFDNNIVNFFLPNYKDEKELLTKLSLYLKKENFDIILGWNVSFDWTYLSNRWRKLLKGNFSSHCSCIGRSYYQNDLFTPAGTEVLDYLEMYKKVFSKGIKSYTLDYILEYEFGKGKVYILDDYSKIDEKMKLHNIEDVKALVNIERKHKLIDFYNNLRKFVRCSWSDTLLNSRMIDILILREARKNNIVLPNKSKNKKQTFKGAYRKSNPGYYKNVFVVDIVSAYPSMIINFNLSPENVGKEGININGVSFKQKEGIIVKVAKELGKIKAEIKEKKKKDKKYESLYAAIKTVYNSIFGVLGFSSFRLFDIRIPKTITFLVRDMLHYIEKKIDCDIIFIDTDSICYKSDRDLVEEFNKLAKQWAKEKYNKTIDTIFESEKPFEKLLNVDDCHYAGKYYDGSYKIRGLEMKSASSSKFKAEFQKQLIEKIFNESSYKEIKKWVEEQKTKFKNTPLLDIAFPAKIKDREYKSYLIRDGKRFEKKLPIFVRALNNSKLKKRYGELFYWVYLKGGDVIAIDKKHLIKKEMIDWDKMMEKNIEKIWKKIKGVMGWGKNLKLF